MNILELSAIHYNKNKQYNCSGSQELSNKQVKNVTPTQRLLGFLNFYILILVLSVFSLGLYLCKG